MPACQCLLVALKAAAVHEQNFSNVGNALGNTSDANDHIPRPHDDDDDNVPEFQLKAGRNIQQGATKFLRASLGVRRMPHPVHAAAAAHEASGSCSGAQQVDTPDNQMVVTTFDGQVLDVSMTLCESTDAAPQSHQFEAKSSHVELQRGKWVSSVSASGALRLGPLAIGDCIFET